jgi:hypothetical protein
MIMMLVRVIQNCLGLLLHHENIKPQAVDILTGLRIAALKEQLP